MISIFDEQEGLIEESFIGSYKTEVELFTSLLRVYESFIKATSGKVKDNEYPNWSILMLLSQVLPLMNNALVLLAKGYLRSSEIMIRVASEGMILAAYFKEFPDAEKEYRSLNYRDFFHNHKIEKMLKRVENEGKLFIRDKIEAKNVRWNKIVFKNLFEESSKFLHNNPDLIYDMSLDNRSSNPSKGDLILGPQLYSDESLAMGLRRLFNALLFSLVILGVSLNIAPDEAEKTILTKSSEYANSLNKSP